MFDFYIDCWVALQVGRLLGTVLGTLVVIALAVVLAYAAAPLVLAYLLNARFVRPWIRRRHNYA